MSEATQLVERALRRAERRAEATPRVDYNALNRMVRRQRSALTRAVNSGDPERVILVVHAAVSEWNQPGVIWPDDWARWQSAVDAVLPFHQQIDIRDLD